MVLLGLYTQVRTWQLNVSSFSFQTNIYLFLGAGAKKPRPLFKILKNMIKTYKARVNNNNVSYLLEGKQGNKVRYNFTNGNVVINKYPSLTLRNRYCQELLESNPLFLNNTIILERSEEEYPGEQAALDKEKQESEQVHDVVSTAVETSAKEADKAESDEAEPEKERVLGVVSTADVIEYVNKRFDKDYRTLANAMKQASKYNIIFPDFEP